MSLYHCNFNPVRRSQGKCAVHSAAYFRGAKMYAERTGTIADFRGKSEVVFSKLYADRTAPEWVQELIKSEEFAKGEDKHIASEILFNKAEKHNILKNSRPANTWTIALQRELSIEQNLFLNNSLFYLVDSCMICSKDHNSQSGIHKIACKCHQLFYYHHK